MAFGDPDSEAVRATPAEADGQRLRDSSQRSLGQSCWLARASDLAIASLAGTPLFRFPWSDARERRSVATLLAEANAAPMTTHGSTKSIPQSRPPADHASFRRGAMSGGLESSRHAKTYGSSRSELDLLCP